MQYPTILKANGTSQNISKHFKGKTAVSTKELFDYLKSCEPELPDSTISGKIYLMKQAGELTHVSRGIYSFTSKAPFTPTISPAIKKLNGSIKKQFPFLNFCIWDTRWFNSFMLHQPGRFYMVIETEKEAVESLFNRLSEGRTDVFLDPDAEMLQRYVSHFQESVIVKSMISEAPVISMAPVQTASIEKLLVDCLAEKNLLTAQQSELEFIYNSVFEKYNVNINKARRYARRRDQLEELEKLMKKHIPHLNGKKVK